MNSNLTLGSLFDGSGGFPLGGMISGITPVWASEIEPFPIRVTTKRLPFMKHYGDVSRLNGADLEPVDVITFGSPCQDMSVAGRRAGLDGSRSNLFYEAVRIAKEMREATNGRYPTWLCWENVPGAFSSSAGADFKAVLDEIRKIKDPEADTPRPAKWTNAGCILADDHSVAWRVFDAQYWGVPQRRKRIYLVADLAGQRAGKVLFESEGLSGYTPQGFRSWQGSAGAAEEGAHPAGVGTDGYNGAIADIAATLGVNCGMSTGRNGVMVLNDQGGSFMAVSEDVTGTLRSQMDGHPPVVVDTPDAIAVENHPTDSRVTVSGDGKVQTLTSRMGTGGNNVPLVMKIRCGCEGGGKGPLIQKDKSGTLATNNDQTLFVPTVYGICAKDSNAMKSDNPNSGFYEAETTRTLDANGGNPVCNQGGMAVVAVQGSMIGRSDRNGPQGCGFGGDVSFTLDATDRHAVAYGIDRATYNMGQNAQFAPCIETEVEPPMLAKGPGAVAHPVYSTSKSSYHTLAEEDIVNTLVATDYKDPPTVTEEPYYIVRRLTPTECARLQGFPDWWCAGLETEEPAEEEIEFWREVFETHRLVTGSAAKPKTRVQIVKWLKDPHADSAEYKLWGNGVALPCVCFVLAGIVYYDQFKG
jgi:DNA (cytosine-5)-methyltransferase 1|nr:MAG TPA: Cytosine specific methyltransferase [Caudoviricetes sp.]